MTDTTVIADLPCPLCGCHCATTHTLTDCGDSKRLRIATTCQCGLQFVTNDKIKDESKEVSNALAKHLKQWNSRLVYKDMMDICSYAEIIRDRTQKYSKMRDKE